MNSTPTDASEAAAPQLATDTVLETDTPVLDDESALLEIAKLR